MRRFQYMMVGLALACLALSGSAQGGATRDGWAALQAGLEFREVQSSIGSIYQIRCEPSRMSLKLIAARDYKQSTMAIAELVKRSGCLAAVNGGYFDTKNEPMGYQRDSKGILSNDLRAAGLFGGVFVVGPRGAELLGREEFTPGLHSFALQCGPRLIYHGEKISGIHADPPARRTGIGVDRKGRIILFASGPTARFTFAETQAWLCGPTGKGGIDPIGVLNLDGGSSTQFSVHAGRVHQEIPGWANIPVAVGVFPR